jgi:hypothetical protein
VIWKGWDRQHHKYKLLVIKYLKVLILGLLNNQNVLVIILDNLWLHNVYGCG